MAGNLTFTMIKPDAVEAANTGAIIKIIQEAGFQILAMKMTKLSKDRAGQFYEIHKERPFYDSLVAYIISGPVVAMVWEGNDAIAAARSTIGATNPVAASPGTIRGDFGMEVGRNLVHGSDSVENGEKEAALFFDAAELVSWGRDVDGWINE